MLPARYLATWVPALAADLVTSIALVSEAGHEQDAAVSAKPDIRGLSGKAYTDEPGCRHGASDRTATALPHPVGGKARGPARQHQVCRWAGTASPTNADGQEGAAAVRRCNGATRPGHPRACCTCPRCGLPSARSTAPSAPCECYPFVEGGADLKVCRTFSAMRARPRPSGIRTSPEVGGWRCPRLLTRGREGVMFR